MADGSGQASLACRRCRAGKRKCNRVLPSCLLCTSQSLKCEYPQRVRNKTKNRTAADPSLESSASSIAAAHHSEPSSRASISAVFFLDRAAYERARLTPPALCLPLEREVADAVGTSSNIQSIAQKYFRTVHFWMPIIPKIKFYHHLLNPLAPRKRELSLLALCMKLVSASSPELERTYQLAKRSHSESITTGPLTVETLQAGVLLALYEIGHAIYPAAYLSVGACARHGTALDLDKSISRSERLHLPWSDIEERRRVWWSILILDRFTTFGDPSRPLATRDPDVDAFLPVDDDAWNDGTAKPHDEHTLSSEPILFTGRFARLAQMVRLLSRTLEHISNPHLPKDRFEWETAQLRKTLFALLSVYAVEESKRRLEFCTQSAIGYSAILLLGTWVDTDSTRDYTLASEDISQEISSTLVAIDAIIPRLLDTSKQHGSHMDLVSPFVLYAVYKAATVRYDCYAASRSSTHQDRYGALKAALVALKGRWKSAGVYLDILEAGEVTSAVQGGN